MRDCTIVKLLADNLSAIPLARSSPERFENSGIEFVATHLLEIPGAATILTEADLSGSRLAAVITQLLGNPERLAAIRKAGAGLAPKRPAAEHIASLLMEVASHGRSWQAATAM
eukprot:scaffold39374_cov50-Prasinocladus_malaysianus.AAC.2